LSRIKGQDVAIEAVHLLRERGVDVRLDLVGDVFPGYEYVQRELEDRVRELGLEESVTFAGYRDDPWSYLEHASVMLVPSRSETFGLAAVEAMATGHPVIASDIGGLREIVRDGRDGYLVPVDDATALGDAIERIVGDHALRDEMARAALDVRTRFDAGRYQRQLVDALLGGVRHH
jgi:glycosyltransferase involved in cell wall biosynthesis